MDQKVNRRKALRMLGISSAGAVLAACTPQVVKETVEVQVEKIVEQTVVVEATDAPASTAVPPQIAGAKVVVMYNGAEFTEAYRTAITEQDGIEIEFLEADGDRYNAMEAAGTPPDLYQLGGTNVANYVVQNRALALDPYIDVSSVLQRDDFTDVIKMYMFEGIQVGYGSIYGIPKDWSPDFTIWINTEAFEESGMPVPSDETPLTWQEIFQMSPKLVKRDGDRTLQWGHDNHYWSNGFPNPMFLLETLPQAEGAPTLYGESFEKVNLLNNPVAMEIIKSTFEMAKEKAIPSTLDPLGTWFGQGFTQGQSAILQTGYWFGGMAESDTTKGKVKFLPAPLFGNAEKRRSSCVWAQGIAVHKKSQVPDAAWKCVEYFMGGEPAQDRAKTGWNLSFLKSMLSLVPQDTEFNKQRYKVITAELEYMGEPLKYNPFQPDFVDEDGAWEKALNGEMTIEEAVQSIETNTNIIIKERIDRLG